MSGFAEELLSRFRWIDGHADVLGLLADGDVLASAVDALADPFREAGVTKVAAIEARGFVLGAGVALRLGAGLVAVRKEGSVHPGPKAAVVSEPDWRDRRTRFVVQRAAIEPSDRIAFVDDWAERGSQAIAARSLLEECGAEWAGISLLVDQLAPDVRSRLDPVFAVLHADDLPPSSG